MHTKVWILAGILMLSCHRISAQESNGLGNLSAEMIQHNLDKASDKIGSLEKNLDENGRKALAKYARAEDKLRRKLTRLDPSSLTELDKFGNSAPRTLLAQLSKNSKATTAVVYLSKVDSLNMALKFLKTKDFMRGFSTSKIASMQGSLEGISDKMNSLQGYGEQLTDRLKFFEARLTGLGKLKEIKKLQDQLYRYKSMVREYKDALSEPEKHLDLFIQTAAVIPGFRTMFNRYSQLAGMFDLTSLESGAAAEGKPGLQTKAMVTAAIQERMGQPQQGGRKTEYAPPGVQDAQAVIGQWKDKLLKGGYSGSDDAAMNAFRPTTAKRKTILQHFELGTTFQTQRADYYFPVITDIGLTVGYKLSERSVLGIGGAFKMGWGKNWQHIQLSGQGFNVKGFVDWRLKGGIFLTGGYERNYLSEVKELRSIAKMSDWQESGLLGLKKTMTMKSGMIKKASIGLLWDFLSYYQVPRMQPFVFRFGYGF